MSKTVKRVLIAGVLIIIVGALLIPRLNLFSASSSSDSSSQRGREALPVKGIIAQLSHSSAGQGFDAELFPNEEVELVSETVGKVVGIYFNDGDRVKKGMLLLKVDDSDLQAQLTRAQYQKKLLEEKLKRQQQLLERESVSLESYEEIETEYNILLADIELLKVKIGRTEIYAPFDGQIGFRYVSEGAYLQPSTKIGTLTDNTVLRAEIYIPDKYISSPLLGIGETIVLQGNETVKAKIYAIDPQINKETRCITARAHFKNTTNLLAGIFLRVNFLFTNEQFIQVPTEAIVPEMEGKRLWVMKEGKAVSVPVETGTRYEKEIEVVSGIQTGDTVLVNGLMYLREGMAVKVSL